MTKKKKKLLWILISVGVVVIAAGVALTFWFTREEGPRLVPSRIQPNQYLVEGSYELDQTPTPLPFYSLDVPSEWTQMENAADGANRTSTSYQDVYQNQAGETLTFSQSAAGNGAAVSGLGEYQAAAFGEVKMILYRSREGQPGSDKPESGAFWIYDQTLLKLSCQQYLETEEMLEWVSRVRYDPPRQPNYTPFTFELVEEAVEDADYYAYFVRGNPQRPDELKWFDFVTPPAGFTKDTVQPESGLDTQHYVTYSDDSGASLTLFCDAVPNLGLFTDTKPPQVQQVQVNGKPGLVQLSDEAQGYEIVWLEDYCMVSLGSTIPMTPEKLVELAETVVQQPET